MRVIQTKTTYLEMFHPPADSLSGPSDDLRIFPTQRPSVEDYRDWYRSVGSQLSWVDRLVMPDEELLRIIHDARVDVFVLSVAGETAGYAELDRRIPGEIELAYFGLFPQFVGRGLGKYFLNWTLHQAWSHEPSRVWVHTCDLDHEAALPTYLKAGFQVFDERIIDQAIPDSLRTPRRES